MAAKHTPTQVIMFAFFWSVAVGRCIVLLMLTMAVNCPQCKAAYSLRSEFSGKLVRCRECSQPFRVPSSASTEATADGLLTCRFCGFSDTGTFCSQCGGRLQGDPFESLTACVISQAQIRELKRIASSSIASNEDAENAEEALFAAQELNRKVGDVADTLRRQERWAFGHLFTRSEADELLAKLEPIPNISDVRVAVWTLISDLERKHADLEASEQAERKETQLQYHVGQFRGAVESGSVARAKKWLAETKVLLADGRHPTAKIAGLEADLAALETKNEDDKLAKSYLKLEEKAAKLSFLADHKKAIKAWQECLFWLSRNDHPEKERLQTEAEQGLQKAQASA